MSEIPDLRDLAPAYALGALDAEEARAFETALADSAELQRDVAAYREVATLLSLRDLPAVPADLRKRLMDRIQAEPRGRDARAVPLPERPGRRLLQPMLGLGLAASVALAAWLGLEVRDLRRTLTARDSTLAAREARLAARERTLNSILEPGVEMIRLTATGTEPPGMQLFWDRNRNTAVLHAFRLRPAPQGRAYQLWLIRNGQAVPSQVFNSDPDGHLLVEGITIPSEPGIEAYAVTEEPAGGSPQPTSTPFLFGRVPTS